MTKHLFITTAILEIPTGVGLVVSPSMVASVLLGVPLDTPAGQVIGRIGGVALVALGVACWVARREAWSRSVVGVVLAMLVYNFGAVAILAHAGIGWGLAGIGLWPGVMLHTLLGIWCAVCLQNNRGTGQMKTAERESP